MEALESLPKISPAQAMYGTPSDDVPVGYLNTEWLSPSMQGDTLPILTTVDDPYLRLGSSTPGSDVGPIPSDAGPDISLYCELCHKFIALHLLAEHRQYHQALKTFNYTEATRPETVEALMKRRATILKKYRSKHKCDNTVNPTWLQKLNASFEFLKADLEDTYDSCRRIEKNINMEVKGVTLNCGVSCAKAVGISSHQNERWKRSMEDTHVFQDYFGNDKHKSFFAVYDGHHGAFAAEVAANKLHQSLLVEMEKFDPRTKCTCTFNMANSYDLSDYGIKEIHSRPSSECSERCLIHEESTNVIQQIIETCALRHAALEKNEPVSSDSPTRKQKKAKDAFSVKMADAFKSAHQYTDYLLSYGKDEMSRVRWSGCSTLACVIRDDPHLSSFQQENAEKPEEEEQEVEAAEEKSSASVEPSKELGKIYLSNAGNCRAVLVRGNRAHRLSRDHTPSNPKEKSRVLKQGGTLNEGERDIRVNGVLGVTRGLGNHGDPALRRCVTTDPYTTSVVIDQYAQLLILASNGFWEVFSEKEAASLVMQMLPSNHVPPPSRYGTSIGLLLAKPTLSPDYSDQSENNLALGDLASSNHSLSHSLNRKVFGGALAQNSNSNIPIIEETVYSSSNKSSDVDESIATEISAQYQEFSSEASSQSSRSSKPQKQSHHRALLSPHDMITEIGSQTEGSEVSDYGNEADIDSDILSVLSQSNRSLRFCSKEEVERHYAKIMSERLVQGALLAGAKDNITVMVILLPGCGI